MYEGTIEFNGELWCRKSMSYYYSGHIYAHSAMETANSCGNCDGGRCENCREIWEVTVMRLPETDYEHEICKRTNKPLSSYQRFQNREDAIKYFENA